MRAWAMDEIQNANAAAGQHFFERDTMRFFKSRIETGAIIHADEVFFVTSEQGPDNVRRFTVRQFNPENGHVWTPGHFNKATSVTEAVNEIMSKGQSQ